MPRLTLLLLALGLTACQPNTSVWQQQRDFICQSLIDGYLKASGQQSFELWNKADLPQSSITQRLFSYRTGSTRTTLMGESQRRELQFVCWNTAQHFAIAPYAPHSAPRQALLTVQIHLPKATDKWQASVPKTQ